ncbi:hypothetical protein AMS62_14380 [Bacillus sp. FJAT-18019]|uniref:Uncharacterized protein n=1 Tax=Paenibacillus solani TaxID=1705565 RepID=A0A0M1N2Z5_9BACL|nr:hypothetical protein AMS62_14380 [Bacillus sp. FJAT-18019]KOR76375.1 hypothetical protein AM231_27605 [Paenibacillus solani]
MSILQNDILLCFICQKIEHTEYRNKCNAGWAKTVKRHSFLQWHVYNNRGFAPWFSLQWHLLQSAIREKKA